MADKKLTQLRALYSKMPEGAGKEAVASKIAKLEASQPKEVVEVKEEVKEVIKKAPKKSSKGKEMRHVFEKKVDGGKEVKVVMASSVDVAKEAMQESDFEYIRTITRGRSPKEGFVAAGKPKKAKATKRATKATRDDMAKSAGMTPEKAERVATKVASAKKRGRKRSQHNPYLFEMPMKTQAGKVKRKVIIATSQESAQKQAGRNYTFVKELKAGENPKVGIQPIKDFVAPPPKKRGRRPKAKAEVVEVKEEVKETVKKASKPKARKKTSKSSDSSKDFTALKELAGSVKEMSKTLAFGISELDKMIDNFSKKYAHGGVVSDEDRGEAVMVSSEGNSVGELQGVDSGTALVDFSDYDRPPSGDKRGYYPISDLRVVEYDWDKDEYYAKGGVMEHGLQAGDTIIDDIFWKNKAVVKPKKGEKIIVDLDKGERFADFAKGGETIKRFDTIVYWEDEDGQSGEKEYRGVIADSEEKAERHVREMLEEDFDEMELYEPSITHVSIEERELPAD